MGDIKILSVPPSGAGSRLDIYIAEQTGISRSQIQALIGIGAVLVNGRTFTQHYKIKAEDVIKLTIPEQETAGLAPEDISVEILYRDEYLIVVNKPANMVVYPAAGHSKGTLMNALAYHCGRLATIGGPLRPGIVHRLDKDTSGVMVIALEDSAYYNLVEQFRERTIHRKYVALVYGKLKDYSGEISLSIGRSEGDRKKMSTRTRRGKSAITKWKILKRFEGATMIEVFLGTGRTHQIRVHLASIGHPVAGDKTYGKKTELEVNRKVIVIPRQMLHAEILGFKHPVTGEPLEFSSPLPEDMRKTLSELNLSL